MAAGQWMNMGNEEFLTEDGVDVLERCALSREDEILTDKEASIIHFANRYDDDESLEGPPHPEDLSEAINLQSQKIFRVINVDPSGMISLRSHSQLSQYVWMDVILQKAYRRFDCSRNRELMSRNQLRKKVYYVVKLGQWYHRCQFLKFIEPKETTGFDIRIRLLDFAVPQVVPIDVFRPMHLYFKSLPSQGFTADLYSPCTNMTNISNGNRLNKMLKNILQDNVYETIIYRVINAFPECPHIHCQFESQLE